MNLAARLYIKTPFGYSGYWFQVGNRQVTGICNLIDLILERFARIYGRIDNKRAKEYQERLASKYCDHPSQTLRRLQNHFDCGFSYPRMEAQEIQLGILRAERSANRQHEKDQAQLANINFLYKYEHDDYCPIGSGEYGRFCTMCNARIEYIVKTKEDKKIHFDLGIRLYGDRVCKSKKCRAVAAIYGKHKWAETKLINAILDSVKNHDKYTQLRKHFI